MSLLVAPLPIGFSALGPNELNGPTRDSAGAWFLRAAKCADRSASSGWTNSDHDHSSRCPNERRRHRFPWAHRRLLHVERESPESDGPRVLWKLNRAVTPSAANDRSTVTVGRVAIFGRRN